MNVQQTKAKILGILSAEKQKFPLSIHFWKVNHFDSSTKTNRFFLTSKTQMTECYQPFSFYKPITTLFDLSNDEQDSL